MFFRFGEHTPNKNIKPLQDIDIELKQDSKISIIKGTLRIDTINELQYYKSDGILNYVLKNILKN